MVKETKGTTYYCADLALSGRAGAETNPPPPPTPPRPNDLQVSAYLLSYASTRKTASHRNLDEAVQSLARDCVFMKSSTKDKIKGAFKEAKGKVKEETGKTTGNPDLRDRGTIEKAGGKVQRKIGDVEKVFEK